MQRQWNRGRSSGWAAGLLLLAGAATSAEEAAPVIQSTPPQSSVPSPAPPVVGLDKLLKLPSSVGVQTDTRGGSTRGEWRGRFRGIREEQVAAKKSLEESLERLEELSGESGAWQMSAPGVQAKPTGDVPVNYQLHQEIKRQREEVARSERALQELRIEANLAGVPEDWRD